MDELSFWLDCQPQPKRRTNRSGPRHLKAPLPSERPVARMVLMPAPEPLRYMSAAPAVHHRPEHMAPSRLSRMPAALKSRVSEIPLPNLPSLPRVSEPAVVAGSVVALFAAGALGMNAYAQSDVPEPAPTYVAAPTRTPDLSASRNASVSTPTTALPITTTTAAPTTTTSTAAPTTTAAPKPTTTTTAAPKPAGGKNTTTGGASFYDYKPGGCAHKTLPKGTTVTVTNLANNKTTTCVVNDRGPFIAGRVIDLERGVFKNVASTSSGVFNARISW